MTKVHAQRKILNHINQVSFNIANVECQATKTDDLMSCNHAPPDSSLGLTLSWPRTLGSETPDTGHRAELDQTGSALIGPELSHVT